MTLDQALRLRAQLTEPGLYGDSYLDPQHSIFIFRHDERLFRLAVVDVEVTGTSIEDLEYYEVWAPHEGFDTYSRNSGHHVEMDDWQLVESYKKRYSSMYSMVQRLVTWGDWIDLYEKDPTHNAWPDPLQPERLKIFYKAV